MRGVALVVAAEDRAKAELLTLCVRVFTNARRKRELTRAK